ncbi:P-loop NTPase fold protein [Mesorhizobium sp.]|uniref:KAP family P-loop NTPase fold protein n=1 Tax=Mesorhizobium sp. TaxID=1871066 RepID=UPI00257B83AF|nr:P-loop NTPase fold protein [Mesorhizobium sp.]
MALKTKHILGDDLPKENPWRDDRLGYAPFAKSIARVIISLTAPNGYVIGLHGQWGSGKSTIINFILAHLKKHNAEHEDDQVIHIDFRPWIVSGHQDMIVAFFKILSEKLGPKDGKWVRFWKRTAGFVSGTTDNLVDAAATVALSVDPSGGVASGFAGRLAKKSVDAMLGRFLEDPSLQAAYENLRSQLGRSGNRFLVTVDDIDRLENSEARSIMQMVKSIGQLPNVVYLLSYDREIVWGALDQGANRQGPRFAEKIVQQEIELPKPTRNALLTILDEEISFLTGNTPDSSRWHYLVRDGVQRWIRSPRDVVRLANAVKFSWPAIEGEIDPADLLAMEGLRLFDTGAFNWVRDNRDFIFTEGRFSFADEKVRQDAVDILKRRISGEVESQVLRVLSVLFPQSTKWFEGGGGFDEAFIEVTKRRGVGSEAGYDTYFGFHPSADAIPKAVVNDLMSRLEDTDEIERIIRSYMGKKNTRGQLMVAGLLDELRMQYRASHPAQPTQALIDALFRVGEEIIGIDRAGAMFQLSPRGQIGFLIRNMLEHWGPEHAGAHLVEAFEKAQSPAIMADVYIERGRELGIFRSDSSEGPTIASGDFERLGQILIAKIEAAAADGTLAEAPFYFDIIRAWGHLKGPEEPKAWLAAGMIESAEFMAKAGRGLVSYSVGTAERRYTMRDRPEPEFYDLQTLVDAGRKHLSETELTRDQRNLLTEIVRGSLQLQQGQSSENTGELDDD